MHSYCHAHRDSHFTVEGNRAELTNHNLSLVNSPWPFLIAFLSSMCFGAAGKANVPVVFVLWLSRGLLGTPGKTIYAGLLRLGIKIFLPTTDVIPAYHIICISALMSPMKWSYWTLEHIMWIYQRNIQFSPWPDAIALKRNLGVVHIYCSFSV